MREGWEIKKLGEIFSLEYGKPLDKTKRKTNGLFPIYGANGIIDRTNEYLVDGKTIIVGRKGSAGEINYTEDKFWPLDVTYFVKFDKHELSLNFLFYLLSRLELTKLAKGVKPGINRNEVYSIKHPIPPLPEQHQIVSIIDKAFSAIDKAKANIERNLQNAKELFQSQLNEIFSHNGDKWKWGKLPDISENLDKIRIPITKSKRNPGHYPYYGASGIVDYVDDYLFDEELLLISEDGANLLARSTPIAFKASGKYWVNNHAHVLRFKEPITMSFIEWYFASIKIDEFVSGMAQPKLSQSSLNKILVPKVDILEQERIVFEIDKLNEQAKLFVKYSTDKLNKLGYAHVTYA